MEAIAVDLEDFSAEILKHLELFTNSTNLSANESHSERHKQNSKSDLYESEPAFEKDRSDERETDPETLRPAQAGEGTEWHEAATLPSLGTPLPMVLEACPDILDYIACREGQGSSPPNWPEFLKAAELVRAMLGISPDAWRDAVETMGQADASIVVAAILQKGDEVRFPGGYLRALTEKKREGQFSVGPILMALIGTKLKAMRGDKDGAVSPIE
jgi:replication initiation protein RepC